MQKNFNAWNEKKKIVHDRENAQRTFFKEQEIWWSYIGLNVGYEQDGKGENFMRPILILKKLNPDTFIALPLTTKTKAREYLIPCPGLDGIFRQGNITQIKTLDIKRLHARITYVPLDSFTKIKKSVKELF
ncbi:MAG: type II toxin-antitoxin system PemK/MazF family toxin [Candidatus Pacebacteria bacterium]|nr:type II toxin-antitoxin system PemK/MazF family toxin [Candidatus Paceibacterota bacterium]